MPYVERKSKNSKQTTTLYELPDENLSLEEAIQRSRNGRKQREYKQISQIYEKINTDSDFQKEYQDDLKLLYDVIENKAEIQRMMNAFIKKMPEKRKQLETLQSQLDALYIYEQQKQEVTIENLENLKQIANQLRSSTNKLADSVDAHYLKKLGSSKEVRGGPVHKTFTNLRNTIDKSLSHGIFEQGYRNQAEKRAILENNKELAILQEQALQDAQTEEEQRQAEQLATLQQIQRIQKQQEQVRRDVWDVLHPIKGPWDKWSEDIKERNKMNAQMRRRDAKRQERIQNEAWGNDEEQYLLAIYQQIAGVAGADQQNIQKDKAYKEYIRQQIQNQIWLAIVQPMRGVWDTFASRTQDLTPEQIAYINKKVKELEEEELSKQNFQKITDGATNLLKQSKDVSSILIHISQGIQTASTQISETFRDMFSPIGQLLSLISGTINAMSQTLQVFPSMLSLIQLPFNFMESENKDDEEDDEGKKKESAKARDKKLSTLSVVFEQISLFCNFMAQGINLQVSAILGGINLFTTILNTIFSALKKIFSTSKVMDQILNLFNLCITMFFMPFFNMFGNTLLEYIFQLLTWAQSFNDGTHSELMEGMIRAQNIISEFLLQNLGDLKTIFTKVISELLPAILEVTLQFIPFILYFTQTLINKHEEVVQLARQGIEAGEQMLEGKIITLFILFGTQCMNFLSNYKESIKTTLVAIFDTLTWVINNFGWVIGYIEQLIVAFGQAIGAYLGVILALQGPIGGSTVVPALLARFGLQSFTAFELGVMGQGVGTLIALAIVGVFFSFQEGGYIPQTPGGVLVRVAEKETEYIIPQSKIHMIRGHNNLLLEINGDVFCVDDCEKEIASALNEQSNYSRFR